MKLKKAKKLIHNPKLFFKDFYKKRKPNFLGRKEIGKYSYSVVSAVYNSEKYLDDFFISFEKQSLNFNKNITLIMIDDGSKDNSAKIIKKWANKHPENIIYIYKENGGQASARNLGLEYVKSDWVTFIDSDDFVAKNYFHLVDNLIESNDKIKLVCCNQIYYIEDKKQFIDRHPLNYRFKNDLTILDSHDLEKHMQFSAPLAFFKTSEIPPNLKFDETLKPTFEDGKFVAHYLLNISRSKVAFYAKPKYYNRKREDKSSTMDNAWLNKGQYGIVLENGYIPTLKNYQDKLGYVPSFLQRTILWEMLRLVKHLVNQDKNVSFLSIDEKDKFLKLLDETFTYIDKSTIMNFELGSCGFSRQIGMLGCFKNEKPDTQVAYIDKYDEQKDLLLIRYFTCNKDETIKITINDLDMIPEFEKLSIRNFLTRTFLIEKRLWIKPLNGLLSIEIDNKPTNINYFGTKHKGQLNLITEKQTKKNSAWVFIDRDDMAGDNAEFLYESIIKSSSIEKYFILSDNSKDWTRLKNKGFNLIKFGSTDHKLVLSRARYVLSSHVGNLINPFEKEKYNFQVIFLQHGVTKDNISKWINNCHIDLMLTATNEEHISITKNENHYIYGEKEIKLTGFPRFDSLNKNKKNENIVLIMPTWRKSLAGNFIRKNSSQRIYNKEFRKSNYFYSIQKLLENDTLKNLAITNNFKVVFCPHPNMKDYLKEFCLPKHISIPRKGDSIHELLLKSKLLITDYSSVSFDFAYMKKPIIYYQFDEEEFYLNGHTYDKGYYDYREHGFGPVANTHDELEEEIRLISNYDFINPDVYIKRINDSFPFIDSNNCKRVIEILTENTTTLNPAYRMKEYALRAASNGNWQLCRNLLGRYSQSEKLNIHEHITYVRSLRECGDIELALSSINSIKYSPEDKKGSLFENEMAKLKMSHLDWHSALASWSKTESLSDIDFIYYSCSLIINDDLLGLNKLHSKWEGMANPSVSIILKSLRMLSENKVPEAVETIQQSIITNIITSKEIIKYKVELILSLYYLKMNMLAEAFSCIEAYEKHSKSDIMHRYIIIFISYKTNNHKKVIKQFESLNIQLEILPHFFAKILAVSFFELKKHNRSLEIINELHAKGLVCDETRNIEAEIHLSIGNTEEAIRAWEQIEDRTHFSLFRMAQLYREIGLIDDAYECLSIYSQTNTLNLDALILKADLAQLKNHWSDAIDCWHNILQFNSAGAPDYAWQRFSHCQMMLNMSSEDLKAIS